MKSNKIEINTPFIKLDSFLKFAAISQTGGHSKLMIENGEVLVDGVVCLQRGKKLYNNMVVTVNNENFEVVGIEG